MSWSWSRYYAQKGCEVSTDQQFRSLTLPDEMWRKSSTIQHVNTEDVRLGGSCKVCVDREPGGGGQLSIPSGSAKSSQDGDNVERGKKKQVAFVPPLSLPYKTNSFLFLLHKHLKDKNSLNLL